MNELRVDLKQRVLLHTSDKIQANAAILLLLISVALRLHWFPYSNFDLDTFNLRWYQTILDQGITNSLATDFSNYNPPYTYLLALATLTHEYLKPIIALKLIPIAFDIAGAWYVYRILRLRYLRGNIPFLAVAVFFGLPTVMINSAYWGQADSIYTSMLLACLFSILTKRYGRAMLAFGVALAFKAQAVLFLPFLGLVIVQKRISWRDLALIPIIYFAAILPVVWLGRPLGETLLIYADQANTYGSLSMNAPNLYSLFPDQWYSVLLPIGLATALLAIVRWIFITAKSDREPTNANLLLYALIATALTPFLLPKMHDRYFYAADVLSLVVAFYLPGLWFLPVAFQLSSFMAISVFLFGGAHDYVVMAALLNTVILAFLLRTQRQAANIVRTNPSVSSVFSWLGFILIPILLFCLSLSILFTPIFPRIESRAGYTSGPTQILSQSERFRRISHIMDYLVSKRGKNYLSNLRLHKDVPMFDPMERASIKELKNITGNIGSIWLISLLSLFVLSLLAWIGGWLPKLRIGIGRGGWLAGSLGFVYGIFAMIWLSGHQNIPLLQLFPVRVWQDIILFTSISVALVGAAIGISMRYVSDQIQ